MLTRRLNNLSLLALSFLHYLRHGRANKIINEPKKILVVQLAKLGDMVCTTPMFRAIKERYPKVKLFVMGDKVNKELLESNNDVDGYLVRGKYFKAMKKELIQEKFDIAFMPGPSPENLALLYLSGIPSIVVPKLEGGWSPMNTKAYRLLSRLVQTKPHYVGQYAPREYLRLLEAIGIESENTKKHLGFSEFGEKKALEFYRKNNIDLKNDFIVGISPSTGYKIKLWSREKFAKVADWLYEKHGAKIVLIGSDSDSEEVKELLHFKKKDTIVANAFCIFNVDELKAAISKMSILISVDTGPVYIAEAFGVATIDIVGPMNDEDQPPRGPLNRIVKAERNQPELTVLNVRSYNLKEAQRQSDDITAEMVISEIEVLIKTLNTRERSR